MNLKLILALYFLLLPSAWAQSEYLQDYQLPSLAIGVIQNDRFVINAAGVKSVATNSPISPDDTYHLGSQAKAMTAFLINQEVKAGKISYDTLVQSFYSFNFHPDFKTLRVKDLVFHEAGLPRGVVNAGTIVKTYPNNFTLQRSKVAEDLLTAPAVYKLGTSSGYSNAGYVILGNILEKLNETSVEEIFKTKLFAPFKMNSCGFGANQTATGHYIETKSNKLIPILYDNFQLFASAGTIFCSLEDWGKFLTYQMKAIQRNETYLWQISKKQYTLGAMFLKQDNLGNKYFWHNGTNCVNYADQIIIPAKNRILMFATNRGGDERGTCDDKKMDELRDLFNKLYNEYK